jgi:hypothetical protein
MILAFDPDVLLAALLAPTSPSARLLQLAPLGIYQPFIAQEALATAEAWAREGVGGRVVTEAELLAFRAAIGELLAKDATPPDGATRCGRTATTPEALLETLTG